MQSVLTNSILVWYSSNSALQEVTKTAEKLLDNTIQKGRAQLSIKTQRHRPSRSRYRDSVSSTEGDDGLDKKGTLDNPVQSTRSPLHLTMRGSSPSPDLLESSRSPAFSFDASLVRHSPEDGGLSLAAPPKGRYKQLTNATCHEALVTPNSSPYKSCPSSDSSPVYMRRNRRPDKEDLGVTLRCSYIRVRKYKSSRLSVGSREPSESPSRCSASFVSFSWFTEGRGSFSSSGTPPCSPKIAPLSPQRP
ncbi:sterile alpha motif domain-containing protein 14-like [Nothobranchius furzeri]|uniref:sterile alpha motif domain-containing protein 14-like n=1 Tax=Nothobranchius furzeri TaxID=105023 RepID=UPI00390466EC